MLLERYFLSRTAQVVEGRAEQPLPRAEEGPGRAFHVSSSLSLAFALAALLLCFASCGKGVESEPGPPTEPTPLPSALSVASEEPRVPDDAPPVLIAWTSISPYDGAAEVLEKLVKGHNYLHPERPAALRYIDADGLAEEAAKGDALDLPPTLFFLPSAQVQEMAQNGLVTPVGELAARAGLSLDAFYAAALDSVTVEDRLWALPFCGKMELRYVNTGAKGVAARRMAPWDEFLAGRAGFCDASSDRLRTLTGKKRKFQWEVRTQADDPRVGRQSFQTFALAVAKDGPGEEETVLDLMRITQERDTTLDLWVTGSKIPVRQLGAESEFVKGIRLRGKWLGDWGE